jgi:hypothetical protein
MPGHSLEDCESRTWPAKGDPPEQLVTGPTKRHKQCMLFLLAGMRGDTSNPQVLEEYSKLVQVMLHQ